MEYDLIKALLRHQMYIWNDFCCGKGKKMNASIKSDMKKIYTTYLLSSRAKSGSIVLYLLLDLFDSTN